MFKKVQVPVYNDIFVHDKKTVLLNQHYFDIKNEYLSLINNFRENENDEFIGGMPVQIQKDCTSQLFRMKNNKLVYGITLKVDGERFLMFLSKNNIVYLIDRSTNIFYFENDDKVPFMINGIPFLFDGELIENKGNYEYLVFDVLFFAQNNKLFSWINNTYYDRHFILYNAVKELENVFDKNVMISAKKWFAINEIINTNNIYNYIQSETSKGRNNKLPLHADGLILQPFDTSYVTFTEWNRYNNVQFKWKPAYDLTIDFQIKANPSNDNEWILLTKTGEQFMIDLPLKLRKDKSKKEQVPAKCIPTESEKRKYQPGDVAEFVLKSGTFNFFTPLRKRNEKSANSYQTIMSTLDVIKNPFTLDTLKKAFEFLTNGSGSVANVLVHYQKNKLLLFSVHSFFKPNEIKAIENVYNEYITHNSTKDSYYEMEMRIFKKGKKGLGVDKFTYFYFLDFLKQHYRLEDQFSVDVLLNKPGKEKYRSSYSDFSFKNPINQVKIDLGKNYIFEQNEFNLDFKLSLANEKVSSKTIGLKSKIKENYFYNLIRIKRRHSVTIKNWRIDITRVISTYRLSDVKNEHYELECEYVGEKIPFEDFIKSLNTIYTLILENTSYC
jgi:hypothetical protein